MDIDLRVALELSLTAILSEHDGVSVSVSFASADLLKVWISYEKCEVHISYEAKKGWIDGWSVRFSHPAVFKVTSAEALGVSSSIEQSRKITKSACDYLAGFYKALCG